MTRHDAPEKFGSCAREPLVRALASPNSISAIAHSYANSGSNRSFVVSFSIELLIRRSSTGVRDVVMHASIHMKVAPAEARLRPGGGNA